MALGSGAVFQLGATQLRLRRVSDPLPAEAATRWQTLLQRRQAGEPVAYLLGEKEFGGLTLQVDARVLVPRPDTEVLVEWALEVLQSRVVPRGVDLFSHGDRAHSFPVVLSGRIDVSLTGPSGREILLYSVEAGQSCIQTTLGLLGDEPYSGTAATISAGWHRAASFVISAPVSAAEVGIGISPAVIAPRNRIGNSTVLPSRISTRCPGCNPRANRPVAQPRTAASRRP